MKILCIEDDRSQQEILERALKLQGHNVQCATVPLDGMRIAQEFAPDVILLDIYLNDKEMDGLIVAQVLSGSRALQEQGTAIIAMTAVRDGENPHLQERMIAAGCTAFVYKPLDIAGITQQIEGLIAHPNLLPPDAERTFLQRNSADLALRYQLKIEEFRNLIREVTRLHDSLLSAERLGAMGRLAMQLAHEINNPLAAIVMHVECLKSLPRDGAQWQHHYDHVQRDLQRLTELSRTILQSNSPSSQRFQNVELDQIVRDNALLYARKAQDFNVEVILELPSHIVYYGARAQLQQLVGNLIDNGIEAMPDGGRLTVSLLQADKAIYLSVSDEGGGIPAEARIFELFYTTKEDGHGIGLYVCKLVAQAHRAQISWGPNEPRGAVFTVKFTVSI